jgi:hypothetical protein
MNTINSNILIYIVLAIIVIFIIISIVKKAVKLLIFLIMVFFLFFAYNVFIKGASPVEETKGYISDVKYGTDIVAYSNKIKLSIDNIDKAISSKDKGQSTLDLLKIESSNLNKIYVEVKSLEHREKFNSFHDKYCLYVKGMVGSTDGIIKLGGLTEEKNYQMAEETVKRIKFNFEELSKTTDLSKIKELISTSTKKD